MRSLFFAALMLAGCEGTPLERSCAGESVLLCGPREHSEASAASLEPEALPIADFAMNAQIHVEIARCADAPAPHVVELSAIVPGDGGGVRVTSLLTLQDGADGDPVADDDVIDVTVPNPFVVTIPANTDITLRFTPRSTLPAGCSGTFVEIPYRTGPPRA